MKKKELLSTLKVLAYKRMEISVKGLDNKDAEYQAVMDRVVELRDKYEALELKTEEKRIIDGLLDALDDVEVEQSRISYLAGMADGVMILENLGLLKE